jgi:hypothetical protein
MKTKTKSEAQPVAVIETTDKAELLAEVRQLKKMLLEILSLLKEIRETGHAS